MALYYFVPALRIVLGSFFIATGAIKFMDLKAFSRIVESYGVLPRSLARISGYVHPFAEFFIGWWVLYGQPLFWAGFAASIMMLTADIMVLAALKKKKKLENCGCYGVAVPVPLDWRKFWHNMIWTGLCLMLMLAAI